MRRLLLVLCIVFAVKNDATKADIKNAVEKVYNVKVKSVGMIKLETLKK